MNRLAILGAVLLTSLAAAESPKSDAGREEANRSIQKVLQFFSPAWIDGKPEASPRTEALGSLASIRGGGDKAATAETPRGEALPFWLPYCFLADEGTEAHRVDQRIKYLVDEYAKCGVVVEPFIHSIKGNYPQEPVAVQSMARAVCNFQESFDTRGAIQIDTARADLPGAMCNDPGADGCSTLCEKASISILGPEASPGLAVHESLHGNCCGRTCVNRGAGTEPGGPGIDLVNLFRPEATSHAGRSSTLRMEPISEGACASIRAGAARNDGTHVYFADRQRYFSRPEGITGRLDLTAQRALFVAKPVETRPAFVLSVPTAAEEETLPASEPEIVEPVRPTRSLAFVPKGTRGKRGAALNRGPSAFKRQTDVIISTRPAPDFSVATDSAPSED